MDEETTAKADVSDESLKPTNKRSKGQRKRKSPRWITFGETLAQIKTTVVTERGELDVDENNEGIITIGGRELSFGNWGEMTGIEDDDVVQCSYVPPKPRGSSSDKASKNENVAHETGKDEIEVENGATQKKPEKQGKALASNSLVTALSFEVYPFRLRLGRNMSRQQKQKVLDFVEKNRVKNQSKVPTNYQDAAKMLQEVFQFRLEVAKNLSPQQKASWLDILRMTELKSQE